MTYRFLGEFPVSLDEKRRSIIPVKFRSELDKHKITALESIAKVYDEVEKYILLMPCERKNKGCLYIKQNRIILPREMLKRTNIQHETIFVGRGDYFEIWSRMMWENYKEKDQQSYQEHLNEII